MNTFRKKERLCSRKQIDAAFAQGSVLFVYPFKAYCRMTGTAITGGEAPCRVMITVPKRLFKKAVCRNLLKRRTREAFRLHKQELTTALITQGKSVQLILCYVGETMLPYDAIAGAIRKINSTITRPQPAVQPLITT
jgi:ribonuclease P protein component